MNSNDEDLYVLPGTCKLCEKTAYLINLGKRGDHVTLWQYEETFQNIHCLTCQALVSALEAARGTDTQLPSNAHGTLRWYSESLGWILGLCLRTLSGNLNRSYIAAVWLVRADEKMYGDTTIGTTIFSPQIDRNLVKHWIDQCDQNHAGTCHTITEPWAIVAPATGLLFINLERRCLDFQSEDPKFLQYAASSYLWGKRDDVFQTLISNVEELCLDGAFDTPSNLPRVPRTVDDAMQYVRSLGIRYLWVDRYCIVQNDVTSKSHQIAAMASVYANVYITIVASEGNDGSFGLPGSTSQHPREQPFRTFDFGSTCRMVKNFLDFGRYGVYRIKGSYGIRGWTFQEYEISRRKVEFHNQSVSWKCQLLHQNEFNMPSAFINPDNGLPEDQLWTQWPNLQGYLSKIEDYNRRDLLFPEDLLRAFDAIVAIHGGRMKGGMLYGLPEIFFSAALLWEPTHWEPNNKIVRRRTNLEGNVMKHFSSWLWTGWTGEIDTPLASAHANYLRPKDEFWHSAQIIGYSINFYKLSHTMTDRSLIKETHHYEPRLLDNNTVEGLSDTYEFTRFVPQVDEAETVPLR